MSAKRRRFGAIRRLPSGRFQARHRAGDGRIHHAPTTFDTEREAEQFLAVVETDLLRGRWLDPAAGDVQLDVYAPRWIRERPVELQPRTLEIYDGLLRNHIYPAFGGTALCGVSSASMRSWHASLRADGVGATTVAKAYRLLKAIMATAVDDDLIARNPCRLRNAGVERTQERKPPSIVEVQPIADAIEPRYRALVLLGAWSGLRWGELAGLSRQRIDRMHGIVRVEESMIQLGGGKRFIGPPKSAAGRRTVAMPPHLWPDIEDHLAMYVDPEPTALVFTKESRVSLDRNNFHTMWRRATRAAGVPDYHFHDLRHLAATMAAVSGATTRELMSRLGHSSSRAALIYQHATEDRDLVIAEAMSKLVMPTPLPPRALQVEADG